MTMSDFELEDFDPNFGEFTLSQTKKTYHLRKITLADEIWLKNKWGAEALQKIFSEVDIPRIVEIAFRQLTEEDKQEFKCKKVKFIDDKGKELETEIGGTELLFWLIAGWEDKKQILDALVVAAGLSRPNIKVEDGEVKKKLNELTGSESLISSQANTVGL
jgi:hypothetical protein